MLTLCIHKYNMINIDNIRINKILVLFENNNNFSLGMVLIAI